MGSEEPDVWPRTVEISFGKVEVSRHEFYDCFEPNGVEVSAFDAVVRLPGRAICLYRVGFKTDEDHVTFLRSYGTKQSVSIRGKEVSIRVRDRTLNLVRVRVHQFKFNDDLGMLTTRLRQYGTVTRISWDTYQDRQLPKWCGIKTGVVNVDMEIRENIPSYISFGNYRHPLMVEYAGQTKTCRLCESQLHVASTCPKLIPILAPKQIADRVTPVPRSFSEVAAQTATNKPSASGWQRRQGGKNVPTEEPNVACATAESAKPKAGVSNDERSNPDLKVIVVEEEDMPGLNRSTLVDQACKRRKKSLSSSKELGARRRSRKADKKGRTKGIS